MAAAPPWSLALIPATAACALPAAPVDDQVKFVPTVFAHIRPWVLVAAAPLSADVSCAFALREHPIAATANNPSILLFIGCKFPFECALRRRTNIRSSVC